MSRRGFNWNDNMSEKVPDMLIFTYWLSRDPADLFRKLYVKIKYENKNASIF